MSDSASSVAANAWISCPTVIGTASCISVRPIFTMRRNSCPLAETPAPARRRLHEPVVRAANATLSAVGTTSLVDCAVQVVVRLDRLVVALGTPVSSSATFAITSLMFMLAEVPAPPWYEIDRELVVVSALEDRLARLLDRGAASPLDRAGVRVRARRGELHEHERRDELRVVADRGPRCGSSRARARSARRSTPSAGTFFSPSRSFSVRNSCACAALPPRAARARPRMSRAWSTSLDEEGGERERGRRRCERAHHAGTHEAVVHDELADPRRAGLIERHRREHGPVRRQEERPVHGGIHPEEERRRQADRGRDRRERDDRRGLAHQQDGEHEQAEREQPRPLGHERRHGADDRGSRSPRRTTSPARRRPGSRRTRRARPSSRRPSRRPRRSRRTAGKIAPAAASITIMIAPAHARRSGGAPGTSPSSTTSAIADRNTRHEPIALRRAAPSSRAALVHAR